ncbi:unnamed protein product [Brassica rapa subsp. trilocularis]
MRSLRAHLQGKMIEEATEVALRIYGCDLIQEGGILLNLRPQAVMATGHALFHRLWCKKSLAKFDVKVLTYCSCELCLACIKTGRETSKGYLPIDHLDLFSKYLRELLFVKSSFPCDEDEIGAATRIKEYMNNNRSKDEIVRILYQQHAIPVYLTLQAWDQTEIESSGIFQEYFVQSLLNPDAETTDQGPTQIAPTSMGTAGRDTGASSSFLRVPPPTGDALIPVQQAVINFFLLYTPKIEI